jgi:ribosomal protein S18 acetylase RimI-like enzyme
MPAAGATVRAMSPTPYTYSSLALDRRTLDEIAVLGARSFYDDPFFMHLSDEPMLRARGLALYMRSHLIALGDSAVATGARNAAGLLVGICVWQKPGTYPLPIGRQVREMGGSLRALIPSPASLVTGLRYTLAVEKARPRAEHWYLCLLAVDPMAWRRGVGSTLLEPSLVALDEDGLPGYLETQKEDNLAFYRRFGFEETERLTPSRGGPPLFTLTRPVR